MIFIQQFQKYICDLRIKLSAAVFFKFISDHFRRQSISVNTTGIHGVIAVSHGNNACMDWNISSFQSVWIATSVIAFMVAAGNFRNIWGKSNIL